MTDFPKDLAERIEKIYYDMDKALRMIGRPDSDVGRLIKTHYALFEDLFNYCLPYIKEQTNLYRGIRTDYDNYDKIIYVIAGFNLFFGLDNKDHHVDESDGLKLDTWKKRAFRIRNPRKKDYRIYNIEDIGTYARLIGYENDTKRALQLLDKFKTKK